MKTYGYIHGTKMKQIKRNNVSNIINRHVSSVPKKFYSSMRGRR